ncbi:DUF4159 domain-containing protein [Prolixibacteraceae bacterium JC049]|nr:DUF4159 domain-containing protein [Prolixibacteraceae bacterium JC049]
MRILPIILLLLSFSGWAQETTVKLGLLKYNGGGDWYANPTSLPNLIKFCNDKLNTSIATQIENVEPGSPAIFNFPFLHMTGHGNVIFSESDVDNLRRYLEAGGFLHIDDNYGMNDYVRRELKKIFPNQELVELPYSHPIYHQRFDFPKGLPKIHEHDNNPPQAFGLFIDGRLVVFYTYETDLGDGWEDPEVHDDPKDIREKALKMGANIIEYAFSN